MKRFLVTVVTTGTYIADLLIEADSEESARKQALEGKHHWHQEVIDHKDANVLFCKLLPEPRRGESND